MTDFHIDGLQLTDTAAVALAALGITAPTPVQAEGIPAILAGHDVVLHAGTGTGKTLAYLLPALQRLAEPGARRCVIVAPGAELAMQTARVAAAVGGPGLDLAAAISTTNRRRERERLSKNTRCVVGTPDRLAALFTEGKLRGVGMLVLDELEPLLATPASAFLPELVRRAEPKLQLVVASATLGPRSEGFIADLLGPAAVVVAPATPDTVLHRVVYLPSGAARDVAVARFIEAQRCARAVVFATDPRLQHHLLRYFGEHRIPSVIVSRDGTKAQRQRGIASFRAGEARVLLTSDAVARGLDLPEVDWVLHYDVPRSEAAYVHRAGRTGRAGRSGVSVLFLEHREQAAVRALERGGRRFEPWSR